MLINKTIFDKEKQNLHKVKINLLKPSTAKPTQTSKEIFVTIISVGR